VAGAGNDPRGGESDSEQRIVGGRYRLDSPVGRGGAGVVWRGEDNLLRRPVAVKEILVPLAGAQKDRDAIRARVLREARALARLQSPAIVTVFDVVEDASRHWIIMELVDAESLGDAIRNDGPIPPARVAAIGLALADALGAAHSAGVLHRDVKPGNVLLGRDGRVRLTDFGIAATEGDATLTGTGALVGSPAYIAPERVRGASGTPASDLWGLAATLYAAVEGHPPFDGPETYAVLTAVVEGRRQPFELAGPLSDLLTALLDRAPEERPKLAEIRRHLRPIAGNTRPVPDTVVRRPSLLSTHDDADDDDEPDDEADGERADGAGDLAPGGALDADDPPETAVGAAPLGLAAAAASRDGVASREASADAPTSLAHSGRGPAVHGAGPVGVRFDDGLVPLGDETDMAGALPRPPRAGPAHRVADPSRHDDDAARRGLIIAGVAAAVVIASAVILSGMLASNGGSNRDITPSANGVTRTATIATTAPQPSTTFVAPATGPATGPGLYGGGYPTRAYPPTYIATAKPSARTTSAPPKVTKSATPSPTPTPSATNGGSTGTPTPTASVTATATDAPGPGFPP
jgi:eukaryotic-like serine/threonine-protein kinase